MSADISENLVRTPMGYQTKEKALTWHLPTMLRWIDDNREAKTLPNGTLVGTVLRTAAERIESIIPYTDEVKYEDK